MTWAPTAQLPAVADCTQYMPWSSIPTCRRGSASKRFAAASASSCFFASFGTALFHSHVLVDELCFLLSMKGMRVS